jgi:oligopeptide/dipeptide ABC transporter ATP-binding protein
MTEGRPAHLASRPLAGAPHGPDRPLVEIDALRVDFPVAGGRVTAVDGLTLRVERGETLALVGESGSGKSLTALALMRLLPPAARVAGRVRFDGRDLGALSEADMRRVRGTGIGMVFQEPMTSLNPVMTVGHQVAERLRAHGGCGRAAARTRAVEMLDRVRIPDPARRAAAFPHQLSGGMRQRVMIAMALACGPRLLIADEPTTALDVTIQAQILDLLQGLKADFGMTILFITHDLGVVAEMADRVLVMRAGRAVEEASVGPLFAAPRMPYTRQLLDALPRAVTPAAAAGDPAPRPEEAAGLLAVDSLRTHFAVGGGFGSRRALVRAVDDVSFAVGVGEVLGVVGESGSGKTTLGRSILRLVEPTSGRVTFDGVDITALPADVLRRQRKHMQIVFQDPVASLNPRMTAGAIIGQALELHGLASGAAREPAIVACLERVGLSAAHRRRYPHEFSGGQRQRIGIARALAVGPRLLVADEPVSALDVSVRAQVIELLRSLQRDLRLALLFISHDLGVVESLSDRVMVMYLGRIMEIAPRRELFSNPRHPYTEALLSATPVPDPTVRPRRVLLEGDLPSPASPPSGCVFRTRCPRAAAECAAVVPPLAARSARHFSACLRQ